MGDGGCWTFIRALFLYVSGMSSQPHFFVMINIFYHLFWHISKITLSNCGCIIGASGRTRLLLQAGGRLIVRAYIGLDKHTAEGVNIRVSDKS